MAVGSGNVGWAKRSVPTAHGHGASRLCPPYGSILAAVDGDGAAEGGDRFVGGLMVGDLVEAELLVGRDVADVDAVLMGPFGALAHEARVHRQAAVPGQLPDGELDRPRRLVGRLDDRRDD